MTTTPLPPLPPEDFIWFDPEYGDMPLAHSSTAMQAYATAARAALEAENKRLREALKLLHQASLTQNAWAHGLSAEYVRDTTRAALKEQP